MQRAVPLTQKHQGCHIGRCRFHWRQLASIECRTLKNARCKKQGAWDCALNCVDCIHEMGSNSMLASCTSMLHAREAPFPSCTPFVCTDKWYSWRGFLPMIWNDECPQSPAFISLCFLHCFACISLDSEFLGIRTCHLILGKSCMLL